MEDLYAAGYAELQTGMFMKLPVVGKQEIHVPEVKVRME